MSAYTPQSHLKYRTKQKPDTKCKKADTSLHFKVFLCDYVIEETKISNKSSIQAFEAKQNTMLYKLSGLSQQKRRYGWKIYKQSALIRLQFCASPAQFGPLSRASIAKSGSRIRVPQLLPGRKLALCLEAFLVVSLVVLLPKLLEVVDLALDLGLTLLVLLLEALDHQVLLRNHLLLLPHLAPHQLQIAQRLLQVLTDIPGLGAGVLESGSQLGVLLDDLVVAVGHEGGLAAGAGHHAFLHILQQVLLAGDAVLAGLVTDDHLLGVVRDAAQRGGQHLEVVEVALLRLFGLRSAGTERFVDGGPAEGDLAPALGVVFWLAVGVVVGVVLVLLVLEDVEGERFVLDDAVAAHALLLVELLDHLVLRLDLHLRLLQQCHQLLHRVLSVYLRRVLDRLCPLPEPQGRHCLRLVVGRRRDVDDQTGQRVAAETLLQKTGELGVAVGHVAAPALRERVDHVAERRQTGVDLDGLAQLLPLRPRFRDLLAAGQVDHRQARALGLAGGEVVGNERDHEEHVGAGGDGVHLRAPHRAVLEAVGEQLVTLLSAGDVALSDVLDEDALVPVLAQFEVAPREVQQIRHLLVVDLHQRHLRAQVDVRRTHPHPLHHRLDDPRQQPAPPPAQLRPHAGVGLARGGLPVAEDGAVDALEGGLHDVLGDGAVDGLLLGLLGEDAVEGETEVGRGARALEVGDPQRAVVELLDAPTAALHLRLQFAQRTHAHEDLDVVAPLVHLRLYFIAEITTGPARSQRSARATEDRTTEEEEGRRDRELDGGALEMELFSTHFGQQQFRKRSLASKLSEQYAGKAAIILMSAIKGKYIDRGSSSRLSSPTSSTRLPTIASRRLDNFSFSIRRHSSFQENPEGEPTVLPLRYHATEELSPEPRPACRHKSVKEKQEDADWLAHSLKMREVPQEELYRSRVGENLKRYGAGMLRRSHRNSLGLQSSEQHLLELHYRLKREREAAIIEREERAAAQRFRSMLSRYESI